jgi:hypothetical protein
LKKWTKGIAQNIVIEAERVKTEEEGKIKQFGDRRKAMKKVDKHFWKVSAHFQLL